MSEKMICPLCAIAYGYHTEGCPALMGNSAAIATPPASHDTVYGPGSASSVDAAHMLMTGSMSEKVSLAGQESAGEAVPMVARYAYDSLHAEATAFYEKNVTLTAELAEAREQRDSLRDECERLRGALTPKPPREGIYPWAVALEPTARNAQFWIEGARKEERKGHAILCAEQAVNAWKNAAYYYAEKLAALSASGREVNDAPAE